MLRKLLTVCVAAVRHSAPRRPDGREERRMAFVRGRAGKHEILAARSNQQGQRQEPAHRVALQDRQPRPAPRLQHAVDADRGEQRDVRAGRHAPHRRRARSGERRDAVDVAHGRGQARRGRAAAGLGPRARLLDRRQRRRAHRHRHARLSPGRSSTRRPACPVAVVRQERRRRSQDGDRSAGHRSRDRRHRPQLAAGARQQRHRRRRRAPARRRAARRRRTSRATSAATTCAPASVCGSSTPFRSLASSATTRGRTTRGRTRATPATGRPITIDEELNRVYLATEDGTGDYFGGHRPGNNLFSASVVCLDLNTGKRLLVFPGDPSRHLGLGLPDARRS